MRENLKLGRFYAWKLKAWKSLCVEIQLLKDSTRENSVLRKLCTREFKALKLLGEDT